MYYSRQDIVQRYAEKHRTTPEEAARANIFFELELNEGDTAYAPGTTKWDWGGPGTIVYAFYANGGGDYAEPEGVHRTYARRAV